MYVYIHIDFEMSETFMRHMSSNIIIIDVYFGKLLKSQKF